jgi:hypothetical protein
MDEALETFLPAPKGYLFPRRVLPDGRVLDILPLVFDRARLVISRNVETQEWIDGW